MKHILSLLASFVLGFSILAQEGSGSTTITQPPNIFPTSPEAASLGKYGEIPVNLSTGRINHSVPLHTISEGGFSLPISLSYNYAGLQVEEIPGAVGLGWDLMGKGMITRQVRGKPDESQFGYIGPNWIGRKVYQYHTNSQSMSAGEIGDLLKESASGRWDTESDKYVVSVGSLSATFYFNHEGQAIFAPYKNYKLTKLPNNGGFKLIDDKGIKYYFNDKETSEREVTNSHSPLDPPHISAWVINKIELPNNKQIIFEYSPYHISQKIHSDMISSIDLSNPQYNECRQKGFESTSKTDLLSQTFGLIMDKIVSPSETISFSYTNQGAAGEDKNPLSLDNIHIKNNVGQNVMQYAFQYDDKYKTRKLLTAIHRGKNNPNAQKNYYRFEYYGTPSEDIAYYKQDYWGYFNGNNNGTFSLISDNNNRAPDYRSTRLGALKRIYYPTKGYSEINYGQNQVYGKLDTGEIGIEDRLDVPINITINSDTYPIDETINEVITIPFTPQALPDGQVKVGLQYYLHSSLGYSLAWMELKRVGGPPTGCNDPSKICSKTDFASAELSPVTKEFDMTILTLEPGDYTLTVHLERVPAISNPSRTPRAVANVFLKYYSGNPDPEPENTNIAFGGIRVDSVKSCDGAGDCIQKKYNYNDKKNQSTAVVLSRVEYITRETHHYAASTINETSPPIDCNVTKTVSSSIVPLSTYIGSPILYKKVEESIVDDNNADLKTEFIFSGSLSGFDAFPYAPIEQRNWRKGLVLTKEYLKKEGNTYVGVAKTINTYTALDRSSTISGKSHNLKVGKIHYDYNSQGHLIEYTYKPRHFVDSRYVNYSELYPMISSKQEEIHNGKTIANDIGYTYDFPFGQLKTQTTTDSKNDTYTTTYEYPYNSSVTVNNKLVSQNRITDPIEVKEKENNTLVSTQITEFVDWGNNIILPGVTKTAKGNNTAEPRVVYHKYDTYGNPLEVSQSDGRHIMYIWGYNNTQPIVKVDNASYTGIPTDVTTLINQLKTVSDTENSVLEEDSMRGLFKNLRGHPFFKNAQVTAYTYDPLIGVTSITDPKGQTAYYKYDDFNRMQYVLDRDQHVVQQVRYNYEGQQSSAIGQVTITPSVSGTVAPNQQITFTAAVSGSSTNMLYTWSVNGVQEQCDTTTGFSTSFTNEGNYNVSVLVYDSQSKQSASKLINITVGYPTLNVPTISKSHTYVTHGASVTYTASGISGGSGSYRYEWYVNNTKQSAAGTTFQYSSNTTATYNVYFKLIDTATGNTKNSNVQKLYVYPVLSTPSVGINTSNIVFTGTTVTFTAGNISGGSGNRRYEWYINNVKQSYTGTTFVKKFDGAGSYTVKFKVIDTTIPSYAKEKSVTVSVYNRLNSPGIAIQSPGGHIVKGTTVTINGSYNGGGSGNYRYEWRVNDVLQSYTGTKLVKKFDGVGSFTIKFRVIDKTIPNHFKEILLTVKSYNPLNTPSITANKDPHIVKGTNVTFTASGLGGGSGSRRYEWYVDGAKQNGQTASTFTYNFPSKKVYNVKFRVIDTKIAPYHYKESNTIVIYSHNALNTPSVSKNHTHVLKGETVTFTAGNIGNGSGSRDYKWYVNGTPQGYTGTQFTYTPNSQANYTIKFEVIDKNIPSHSRARTVSISAYNPLTVPSIGNNLGRVHIVRGTSVTFNATGISGGSGQRRYEWYLNGVKQSAVGTSFTHRHMTKGSYEVEFKVIDTRITSPSDHQAQNDITMYVYDPMNISITPGNANLTNANPSVTFRINSVTGGSGTYSRSQWKLWRMTNPSWTRNVGSGSSYTVGVSENGEYELSVTYTDGLTEEVVLKTMPIIVNKSTGGGDEDCLNCGDQH